MKPEELDHLFRKKLEGLEEVPGVVWSQESAWKKITAYLNGGWNLMVIGLFLVSVLGLILYYYLPERPGVKVLRNSFSEKPAMVVDKTVSDIKPTQKALKISKKEPAKNKKISIEIAAPMIEIERQKIKPLSSDTHTSKALPEVFKKKTASSFLLRRHQLVRSDLVSPSLDFTLPKRQFLQMKVTNELNIKNLIQSFKAQQSGGGDLYYKYEYNNNCRTFLYNIDPKNPKNNTIHISNINLQK